MKDKTILITFLAVVAFSVGCKPAVKTSAAEQIDKRQTETKEAAQDMKDFTFAQKAAFAGKMQSQLAEIHKDLDQLAAKIEKSSDRVKAEARPKLQALREQAAQWDKQLDEARNATESTWDGVKSGARKTGNALTEEFQQLRQWVSDKIAP